MSLDKILKETEIQRNMKMFRKNEQGLKKQKIMKVYFNYEFDVIQY